MAASWFEQALKDEGADGKFAELARSIFQQESGSGKNTKTSNAGAVGGMQIIPSTFNSVADKGWDISDPLHNARAGIRYLGQMYELAKGDPALAAAGYYGGPGGLAKARQGVAVADPRNPNAPTTLQYGQQVAARVGNAAPVQLAQTSQNVPEVQPSVPIQSTAVNPVVSAPEVNWSQLQQAMPQKPVQVADLAYEEPVAQFSAPQFQMPAYAAAQRIEPNFQRFKSWLGKA